MAKEKKQHPKVKDRLHPRNPHRERYDLAALAESFEGLKPFVKRNAYDDETIDFFDPKAVLALNKALLLHNYGIEHWDIPEGYLCPPIPGRADYVHHCADLLLGKQDGVTALGIPSGPKVKCLDIGTGSNLIYPIIGVKSYGWSFVATEIDDVAIHSAKEIADGNSILKDRVELRFQKDITAYFEGMIKKDERFELSMCNPPFHRSEEEARQANATKVHNLKKQAIVKAVKNFGGQASELWCKGGEEKFLREMIVESKEYADNVLWFTSLVAQKRHLASCEKALRKVDAVESKIIPMGQGNKVSRILAWTFHDKEAQKKWASGWSTFQ